MNCTATLENIVCFSRDPTHFQPVACAYKNAQRSDGVPTYSSIVVSPEFAPFLPAVTVIEMAEPGIAKYVYCGTAVIESTGLDLTGHNLLELVPEVEKEGLEEDMMAMVHQPCANFAEHIDLYASGKTVDTESFSVPLTRYATMAPTLIMSFYLSGVMLRSTALNTGEFKKGDFRVGAKWHSSIFVDIGWGVPGLTAHQKRSSETLVKASSL